VSGPLLGVPGGGGRSAGESGHVIRINMPLRIRPGKDVVMTTII
jgi:hypothetical protein